jgi:hypothetical protein
MPSEVKIRVNVNTTLEARQFAISCMFVDSKHKGVDVVLLQVMLDLLDPAPRGTPVLSWEFDTNCGDMAPGEHSLRVSHLMFYSEFPAHVVCADGEPVEPWLAGSPIHGIAREVPGMRFVRMRRRYCRCVSYAGTEMWRLVAVVYM